MVIFVVFFVCLICGVIGRKLASEKGRGVAGFWLSFLFGPIGIVIALLLQPSKLFTEQAAVNVRSENINNRKYREERNIQIGKYQLFLTEKYSIQKNVTLEKYVIGDSLFESLDDALRFADAKEREADAKEKEKEFQDNCKQLEYAYYITRIAEDSNAYSANLNVKDILLAYNGVPITNDRDIASAISSASESNTDLVILRGNEKIKIQIKSGPLGVKGQFVALDHNSYIERVNDFIETSKAELSRSSPVIHQSEFPSDPESVKSAARILIARGYTATQISYELQKWRGLSENEADQIVNELLMAAN